MYIYAYITNNNNNNNNNNLGFILSKERPFFQRNSQALLQYKSDKETKKMKAELHNIMDQTLYSECTLRSVRSYARVNKNDFN